MSDPRRPGAPAPAPTAPARPRGAPTTIRMGAKIEQAIQHAHEHDPVDAPPPYDVRRHVALRRVNAMVPSPDGSWLAVVVERLDRDGVKYVSDLWKVSVADGRARQITRGESRDLAPCFRNDGALGFLSNRAPTEFKADEGAEQRLQVWILPAGGGEPQQLTDEPLGVTAFRFARKADRLVYFTPVLANVEPAQQREAAADRDKNGPSVRRFVRQPVRHWDHWLHQNADLPQTHLVACRADGSDRRDLTPEATRAFAIEPALDVSDDGRRAAATWATVGPDREEDMAILVVDLETGQRTLAGAAPATRNQAPRFSPDGLRIAVERASRSATHAPRPQLAVIDLSGANALRIIDTPGWDRWPHLQGWTEDGAKLLVTADDEGATRLFAIDAAGGAVERLSDPAAGGSVSAAAALRDGRVAAIRSSLLYAPECCVFPGSADGRPTTLGRLSGFTPAAEWAKVERMDTRSSDGATIQSWIVKPARHDPARDGALPALIFIHGGPMTMNSDAWHWRWNALLAVAAGYAVVLPNPRGSTGFGQDFVQGIWGNVWGGQCYADLMAVADALEQRLDIDPRRIAAMGGSFGGYMTNWIGTQTDRFRALVTHASIVTLANFTGTTDHPGWWYLEMGGENPYADPAAFDRYAPLRHIARWKTPALVIHGELDYRCPLGEALQLFEALQYHKVPSELMIFPDEGHWILKPRNIVAWYEGVLDFLSRHLS